MKSLAIIANIMAAVVTITALMLLYVRSGHIVFNLMSIILSLVCMVPHEFLHSLCFKEDVYMYHNLNKGMLFVVGIEDMSKLRFIFMSLCPNIIFGVIPMVIFFSIMRIMQKNGWNEADKTHWQEKGWLGKARPWK